MAASIAKSFTAVNTYSGYLSVQHGANFYYSVSGTFVATVRLEYSQDGGASWIPMGISATAAATGTVLLETPNRKAALIRLNCTAYTSGTAVTALNDIGDISRAMVFNAVARGKAGATSGFVIAAADNISLVTCPASKTASTLVISLGSFRVGQFITGFHLSGQIESAGGTVTVDAQLRKQTAAAADVVDAAVVSMTQLSVTTQTVMSILNAGVNGFRLPVAVDETYYLLVTATTAASTDIGIMGVALVVEG